MFLVVLWLFFVSKFGLIVRKVMVVCVWIMGEFGVGGWFVLLFNFEGMFSVYIGKLLVLMVLISVVCNFFSGWVSLILKRLLMMVEVVVGIEVVVCRCLMGILVV